MATHAYCERVARAPGSGSLCTAAAAGDVVIQVVLPGPGDRCAASVEAGLRSGSVVSDVDPIRSTSAATGEEASAAAAAAASTAAAAEEDEPINLAQYLSELGDEHGALYHDHLFFGESELTLPSAVYAAHSAFHRLLSPPLTSHAPCLVRPTITHTRSSPYQALTLRRRTSRDTADAAGDGCEVDGPAEGTRSEAEGASESDVPCTHGNVLQIHQH